MNLPEDNHKEVQDCPYCKAKLTPLAGLYGKQCKGSDHHYTHYYDVDYGWDETLTVNGTTYYLADIARICNLKAFT